MLQRGGLHAGRLRGSPTHAILVNSPSPVAAASREVEKTTEAHSRLTSSAKREHPHRADVVGGIFPNLQDAVDKAPFQCLFRRHEAVAIHRLLEFFVGAAAMLGVAYS